MTAGEVGGDRAAPHGGEAATAVAVGGASGLVGQASRVTPWAAVGTVGAAPAVDAATAAVALLDEGADLRTAVRRQSRKTAAAVVRHINGRRGGQLSVSSSLTRNAVRATVQLSDCGIAGARPSIGTVRRVVRAGPGEWTGGAATTRGRSTASLASALEREIRGRGPSATSPKFSKVGCRGRCRTAARPSSAALTEDHEQQRTPGRERVVADGDCRTRSGG
ncbi:hypothetical protein I4F81_006185 [Pyropia yezoensis]|uniref:Uncharacterized protein n=1 Tax=Pyropia yezoensis TaxID=2788 RepID=A0ACC3C1J5_PYRYE|nr:hypothetical protein I4F81_006185 [Neopyropia yezoensis]